MAFEDYLATEVAVDYADGLMTRREALRRLAMLGVGATTAVSMLTTCANDGDAEGTQTSAATVTATDSAATESTESTESTGPAPSAPGSSTSVATDGGPAPAKITFAGPASELIGYLADAAQPRGAVLIIHENRGLTAHFEQLPSRFAAAGYSALSIDLLSRVGGTGSLTDDGAATAALGAAKQADLTADAKAGLDELARRHPGLALAVVGFCFGGAQVWALLASGEQRLTAAVPFYGPGPSNPDFTGSPDAAVLGIYAERDSRVNASQTAMDAALTNAGLVHEMKVFPGVDHAFFNDTGARYDATQAAAAFDAVLAWFGDHLR